MRRMQIRLYESDMNHLHALKAALGDAEFSRKYPGLDVWSSEVSTRQDVGVDGEKSLAEALKAEIPEKSIARALEEMRISNEQLSAQNRAMQEQLGKSSGVAARNALIVALLGVVATITAAVFF